MTAGTLWLCSWGWLSRWSASARVSAGTHGDAADSFDPTCRPALRSGNAVAFRLLKPRASRSLFSWTCGVYKTWQWSGSGRRRRLDLRVRVLKEGSCVSAPNRRDRMLFTSQHALPVDTPGSWHSSTSVRHLDFPILGCTMTLHDYTLTFFLSVLFFLLLNISLCYSTVPWSHASDF